ERTHQHYGVPAGRSEEAEELHDAVGDGSTDQQCYGQRERRVGEQEISCKGTDHENLAVSEVDEPDDAVDHGVAEGDEGVKTTELERPDDRAGEERRVEGLVHPMEVEHAPDGERQPA